MITYLILGAGILLAFAFYFKSSNDAPMNYDNISVQDLKQLMKQKDTTLIDVRTKRETSQGVIGKPLEIELSPRMTQKLSQLQKDKTYVVYCRSGKRSAMASKMMTKLGFSNVNNLVGGYLAWQQSAS